MTFIALWVLGTGIYFIGYWRGQRAVVKSGIGDT
jgi:hypothetical protein